MVEYPTNTAFPDIEKANDYLENYLIEIRDSIHSDHPGIDASELEVFTYLKSRNIDCGREVEIVVFHYWDMESRAFINARSDYCKVDNRIKDLTIEEAESLEPLSTPVINFWNEYSDNRYSDDSYFLRFIDWWEIDDFNNIWIDRIIKEYNQLGIDKEIPTDLLRIMLFNHCRSDYSLRLLKGSLLKILSKYESIYFDQNSELITYKKDFIDFQAIAIIVFANIRLKTANLRVIKEGLRILTDNQIKNGGWSVNNKKKESDLFTSAVVIHAIAIAQEPYWQITINPCIEWIKSEQDVSGGWTSKVFDRIPLVVMILDALELAKGSTKVTFTIDKLLISDTTKNQINTKVKKYPLNKFFPNINSKELHWTDIGLDFCSADKIEIKIGKVKKKISIEEFGLNKAHNSWKLLFTISSNNGFIDYPTLFKILDTKSKDAIQQNISRLRKKLSNYFGINEKPISYNSIQRCYQTEFLYFRNAYQKKAEELRTSDKVYFNPKFEILDENKDDFDELDENIDF